LVIVPQGILEYLPFAGLYDAAHKRYLIEDFAISYAPSASALRYAIGKRNADTGRMLALGDVDNSLNFAKQELQAVAKLYGATALVGKEATKLQVNDKAPQVDILHIASPATYKPFQPLFSTIKLAPDAQDDGNLEAHDFFNLNLAQANLVVLSRSAADTNSRNTGSEIIQLNRAVQYAGAPAVISTLWPVEDAATVKLYSAFYKYLRAKQTTAEALRNAQLDMLKQTTSSAPYYWAAPLLSGDYKGSGEITNDKLITGTLGGSTNVSGTLEVQGQGTIQSANKVTNTQYTTATHNQAENTPITTETAAITATMNISGSQTPTTTTAKLPSLAGASKGICNNVTLPIGLVLLVGMFRRNRNNKKKKAEGK
jgi:hypothetical protein